MSEFNQILIIDLIHNQAHYVSLLNDLLNQRKMVLETEDPVFHQEIEKNFEETAKSIILQDVVKRLLITPEDAMIVLNELNLKEYLK